MLTNGSKVRLLTAIACSLSAVLHVSLAGAQVQRTPSRDQQAELAMKMRGSFTFAAVGDLIEMQPFTKVANPAAQSLIGVLKQADVSVANMEAMVVDLDHYAGLRGSNLAPKEVADDIAAMGIDIVTKANNHTFDGGEEGLWETFRQLDRVGIVHVGAGRNLLEARAARYFQSTKGRVGMVGIYALSNNIADTSAPATNAVDGFGGRAGNNTLHLRVYHGVTTDQMQQLRGIQDSVLARRGEVGNPVDVPREREGSLQLFGTFFKTTSKTGDISYEMDAADERDILRNIRSGKQSSDFLIATVHWHQNRFDFQRYSFDHYPADFEIALAHAAIDNGADAVVGHGVHTIKGVEIYKGRPIFYGLSNFVFQSEIMPQPSPNPDTDGGLGEINEARWAAFQKPENLEALLVSGRYEGGKLVEVRIYPADLGLARPGSQMGVPEAPSHDVAQRILNEVQTYSKPFGTTVSIDKDVGVIRVDPSATLPLAPTIVPKASRGNAAE